MDIDLSPIILPFIDNPWVQVFTAVVTLASAVAATTKTPKDGWAAKIYSAIDFLALNFGRAKEK